MEDIVASMVPTLIWQYPIPSPPPPFHHHGALPAGGDPDDPYDSEADNSRRVVISLFLVTPILGIIIAITGPLAVACVEA